MRSGSHPLSLRQLQYIVAVAEELSFRRAAERCRVAQPSLSAQLAQAERALGLRLFDRDRRRVLLTPGGETVVADARRVLLAMEDLLRAAAGRVDPLSGTLRLGVIPTVAPYLLPLLDPALREAFPALDLRWREEKTGTLVGAVEAGKLDGALLATESETGALEMERILDDPFVLAVAPEHLLARDRGPLRLSRLEGHEVLLLDDGHCFRDQALELCASAGARETGFRATSLPTLVQMVAGSRGATLLPASALPFENRDRRLVIRRFRPPAPRRTLALAWRPRSALASAISKLARRSRAVLRRGVHR